MSNIEIKCNKCGSTHTYDCSNLDWECIGSEEKNMGSENEHQASIEGACDCGQKMKVIFTCWEYPAGAPNSNDVDCDGATVVKDDCSPCPNFF